MEFGTIYHALGCEVTIIEGPGPYPAHPGPGRFHRIRTMILKKEESRCIQAHGWTG